MNILVTGARGFIGSKFVSHAAARGHHLYNLPGRLHQAPWSEIDAFEPQMCVHCAWITEPGGYQDSMFNSQLVDDSLEFARGCRSVGVEHFIGLGTCAETHAPDSNYARCKNALREKLARERMAFTWARVFFPYGPGEHAGRFCSQIARQLKDGGNVVLQYPLDVKDLIFIEDVSGALCTIAESRATGLIEIGSGKGMTVKHVAEMIRERIGGQGQIMEQRIAVSPPVIADTARLIALGWRPRWTLGAGLSALVASLKV